MMWAFLAFGIGAGLVGLGLWASEEPAVLASLATAGICLVGLLGVVAGTIWSAYLITRGASLGNDRRRYDSRGEAGSIQLIRDVVREARQPAALPQNQEQMWLPPLADFEVVDAEVSESSSDN